MNARVLAAAAAAVVLFPAASSVVFSLALGLGLEAAGPLSFAASFAHYMTNPSPAWLRALLVASAAAPPVAAAALMLRLRPEKPLHGDARFATWREVKKSGLVGNDKSDSIIVGRSRGRILSVPGERFVFLAAPTRSGKGVGVVIPNCLSWKGSLVVFDIKGENFRVTSGWRSKVLGQPVFRFAPFDEKGRTHLWNPLSYVPEDPARRISEIDAIAASLYDTANERERFWSENAKDLFRGLALLVLESPDLPHTMAQILREASGLGRSLKDHVEDRRLEAADAGRSFSSHCTESLDRVLQNSENTLSAIISTMNVPLLAFGNPFAERATSGDSPGLDLAAVRRSPVTIYVCVTPDRLHESRAVVNLFFHQLISLNTRVLPESDPALRCRCLLVLDEFTSAGRIPAIAESVSFIAGYGLRLLTIAQNRSQLEETYGKSGAVTLLANHAAMILFAPAPAVTSDAREYSEMLGYGGGKRVTRTKSRGGAGRSESEERRALMLPQEISTLDPRLEIVTLAGSRPVLCEKIRYHRDPELGKRLLEPAWDAVPGGDRVGGRPG